MNIKTDTPQISLLRQVVERTIDFPLSTHGDFCRMVKKTDTESEMFLDQAICSADLIIGNRLRIGWPPDRICVIRYLGNNNFIAEETSNSTMQPGDTFSCILLQKGRPLHLDNFRRADSEERLRYVVGINTGLTQLEIIPQD